MASREGSTSSHGRRIVWLAVAIVAAVALYTAGWFFAAGRIEDRVRELAANTRDGPVARCEGPAARGYPFRIGLFCDAVLIEDGRSGFAVRSGAFRSAAQVYNPFHAVSELDGPLELAIPGLGPLDIDWERMGSSVRLDTPLPRRLSVAGDMITVRDRISNGTLLAADHAEIHGRTRGDDLDLAANGTGMVFDMPGAGLPPLGVRVDLTLPGGARLPAGGARFGLRGRSVELRDLTMLSGSGAIASVRGTATVADDGLLDADLTATIVRPADLADVLRKLFPDHESEIRAATSGLAALGGEASVPLTVRRGQARLGFLPLGAIPPL